MHYKDGLFDPIRLSNRILDSKKSEASVGPRAFHAQYLQNPVSSDAGIIKEEWLQFIEWEKFNSLNPNVVWDFFVDTAYGQENGDYTAILCATVWQNNMYIRYVEQNRLEFPNLIHHLTKLVNELGNHATKVYVEPTAAGKPLVQQMKVTTSLNIIEGKFPGKSKIEYVTAVTPQLEAKRIYLLKDLPEAKYKWNSMFVDQCLSFTGESGNTDDMVDTLQMAINKLLVKVNVTRFNYA